MKRHRQSSLFRLARPVAYPLALLPLSMPLTAWSEATQLPDVTVSADADNSTAASTVLDRMELAPLRATTSDTTQLLRDVPGLSIFNAGGVSGLPILHGMADDRLRVQVDGMNLISACPNHMNSPLSYISPAQVGTVNVYGGVVPVSVGGDSIGGTIQVNPTATVFARPGEGTHVEGEVGAFYRSNGNAVGGNLSATIASEQFSISYNGSTAQSGNYHAGGDFKAPSINSAGNTIDADEVGSTAYKAQNHDLGIAWRDDHQLLQFNVGIQRIPYENYPNQRMDLTQNDSTQLNLKYTGAFSFGIVMAQLYRQHVRHEMNFEEDKQFWYNNAPGMPMYTEAKTNGAKLQVSLTPSARDTLKLGTEIQTYRLDDWWPPSGTGGMSPETFWNINNGKRDRLDLYAEWQRQWSQSWMTQIGVRGDRVTMNADPVQGYSTTPGVTSYMKTSADAAAFNSAARSKTDNNLNWSAMARYTPNAVQSYEFGIMRQVRSPSIYERYTWSSWPMAAVMNNFVGDGNGYIGDINLKPEVAHTVTATAKWHDAAQKRWNLEVTPYYSYVKDYIDAQCAANWTCKPEQFNVLQYVNQDARIYGLDVAGRMVLIPASSYGSFTVTGMMSYTHGRNATTDEPLYNIMPLNGKVALIQQLGNWSNTIETQMVVAKTDVSQTRGEVQTGGYALLNLRTSYTWKNLRIDVGIDNLFDRYYALPQGGAYLGEGKTMSINGVPWGVPVPGMGRSIYTSLNYRF